MAHEGPGEGDPLALAATQACAALAEGGAVTQPLIPTFFSEAFGMCVDRFGTPWMIVGPQVQQPS